MKNSTKYVCAFACAAVVAGCSGGGENPRAPLAPSAPAAPSAAKEVTVTATIAAPVSSGKKKHARSREYVSPATLGAVIAATSATTASVSKFGFDLSTANPNCVPDSGGDAVDCTLSFTLAPDSYSVAITLYDTNEAALPASPGVALSSDTKAIMIADGSTATIAFTPHPYVLGFELDLGPAAIATSVPTLSKRDAAPAVSPMPGTHVGAEANRSEVFGVDARALDRYDYFIDAYPENGTGTFLNGSFAPVLNEPADRTGCSTSSPCSEISESSGEETGPQGTTNANPVLLTQANVSQEDLSLQYDGGGGPGAGVTSWIFGAPPSGTQPYNADFSIPDPSSGAVAPYVVPHLYVAPLFGYATDGLGGAATTTGPGGGTLYVWAAQASLPSSAPGDGSGYTAGFGAGETCTDGDDDTVMTAGDPTYYAGYGAVFPITVTPAEQTSCTLDLGDGAGDTVSVTLTAPAALTIEGERRSASLHAARASR